MRVTDEMFGRALLAYSDKCDHTRSLRAALEAALADVPEPGLRGARLTSMYLDEASRHDAEQRAQATEAKLEKVRAWRERYGLPQEGSDELDAILDEAP